ncbi:Alpha/Beta hydrolase protein [Neohortaea acidophila]|uniref:Dipeptidyl-peptidase V n=1 Tax=Neohortaea acidophila TaxID=245834 RepID=A0A6A6PY02_9PEZI|nr:Alpha/Beta hydrolase protein [Neohortaea acidophila]KAF2484599.1 Alpha/Beta hydrolase protein [Neohortaea acidophila]
MTLLEELLDLKFPSHIRVSPNAQQIVYSTSLVHGHFAGDRPLSTIWLAETGVEGSARPVTSGSYNDHSPEWRPDGRAIAFVSDRGRPGQSSAIYLKSTEGDREPELLTPIEHPLATAQIEWSSTGEYIAFISVDEKSSARLDKEQVKDDANVWGEDWVYQRLRLVHVPTKSIITLVDIDTHVLKFSWNRQGTAIAFASTGTPDPESHFTQGTGISTVAVEGKEIDHICTYPRDTYDFVWAGDDIYFIAPPNPNSSVSGLVVWGINLNSSPSERVMRKIAHGEIDDAAALRKAGVDVIVQVAKDMESQLHILQGRTLFSKKTKIDAWDAAFTTDSDEMILAIARGDTNTPVEVYTTTASGGAMVRLSDHGKAFRGRHFGTPHYISCQSKSVRGEEPVRLDGLFVAPSGAQVTADGKPEQPLPTLVYIHGGPYYRNLDEFNPTEYMWSPCLLTTGYGVLTVNYRGASGRGEAFASYAQGGMGSYDYSDVIELVNSAIEQGFADRERLIVSGFSQGGYLSYLACTRNGQHEYGWKFNGAIPQDGVVDWDARTTSSLFGPSFGAEFPGKAPWKTLKTDVSGREGSAIWEFAEAERKGIIPPVLMLHGEQDNIAPVDQARAFRRALQDAKLPFEYVTYPREGHFLREKRHVVDMGERVLRFVDRHIGGK